MQRRVRHAATETRGAEPAALAAECHEVLEAAAVAADPYATVLEQAASQVLLDLAHDETRQSASLFRALAQLRPVRVDGAVEHRVPGAMPLVAPRLGGRVQGGMKGHGPAP